MAGNPAACGTKDLQLTVDPSTGSSTTGTYEFDTTGKTMDAMGWVQKSFTFMATGTTVDLIFESLTLSPGAMGPALDNVWMCESAQVSSEAFK